MAVSTQSVVHYTKSLHNLEGILRYGFRLKYCREDLRFNDVASTNLSFAMVSFCDIPFTDIKNHVRAYGYFGIGLSKAWAKKKKLNPVVYVHNDSNLSDSLRELLFSILSENALKQNKTNIQLVDHFYSFVGFLKNYSGDLKRNSKILRNYNFYSEREWRHIPTNDQLHNQPNAILTKVYLQNKAAKNNLIKDVYLDFTVYDISYIIVRKETQIPAIVKYLKKTFKTKHLGEDMDILISKITSIENIENDY